jgi:nucleotide-binding universal stress UspA family protein
MDDAQQGLDAAVREASAAGGAKCMSGKMLTGAPWVEIVSLLEKDTFDLCVIGTHGRSGLARILLGSVAEKVVRHAPCSVLAVRPDGGVTSFEHALVPTDFSESAEHALELAPQVVRPEGAVTLLHVLELPVAYSGKVPDVEFSRDLDKRAAIALDQAAARIKGKARVAKASRIGYPGAQILAALDEDRSIDLIVMGSHGRTGIKRALMGSVAEKIVRHARCPVLVARKR